MNDRVDCIYKCGCCGELHDDEDDARECCKPEVIELYRCTECKAVHEGELSAQSCCEERVRCPCCARDYGETTMDAFAVKVANHCRTCNPFFSLDQQLEIERQHEACGNGAVGLNERLRYAELGHHRPVFARHRIL